MLVSVVPGQRKNIGLCLGAADKLRDASVTELTGVFGIGQVVAEGPPEQVARHGRLQGQERQDPLMHIQV
jgi:hypothetical protein